MGVEMSEKVINPDLASLGTPLGEPVRSFPGLAPVAKQLSDIQSKVAQLEAAKYELDSIRATLLLNFAPMGLVDSPISTHEMLMGVLVQLTHRAGWGVGGWGVGAKKEGE